MSAAHVFVLSIDRWLSNLSVGDLSVGDECKADHNDASPLQHGDACFQRRVRIC